MSAGTGTPAASSSVGREVGVDRHRALDRPRLHDARPADEQRHLHEKRLSYIPMSPRKNPWSLVYDDRVLPQAVGVEPLEQAADVVVDRLHAREVVAHVALVLPRVRLARPRPASSRRPPPPPRSGCRRPLRNSRFRQALGRGSFRSPRLRSPNTRWRLQLVAVGPGGVVVARRGRLGDLPVGEHLPVLLGRFPPAVRHEEERLVLRPVLQEVDREVGDDVRDVPRDDAPPGRLDERRVVVVALAGQDGPPVEAGGTEPRYLPIMPVGSRRPGVLRNRRLIAEEVEDRRAVHVAVLAGEDRCPARRADRVGDEAAVEPRPPSRCGRGAASVDHAAGRRSRGRRGHPS